MGMQTRHLKPLRQVGIMTFVALYLHRWKGGVLDDIVEC
jgi:hypothetical protein